MVYHSLFDRIAQAGHLFGYGFKQQEYYGTLEAVLDETRVALNSNRGDSRIIRLALHPPRIVRAFVDYKVQNPNAPEIEYLLRDSIQLGLDVYSGKERERVTQELERLRRRTIETGNGILLTRELNQLADNVTWDATNPTKSSQTAGDLVLRTKGAPVLFLALAHGGVAAGMDTYLRYCNQTEATDSSFYVARFSAHKLGDASPRLSQTELAYLQTQLAGKSVVIFDEDRASGNTLDIARHFFQREFLGAKITVVTNLDMKAALLKSGFKKELSQLEEHNLSSIDEHKKIVELYSYKIMEDKNIEEIIGENSKNKIVPSKSHERIPNRVFPPAFICLPALAVSRTNFPKN